MLVRINAAYAVNDIGDSATKRKLKPLALGQAGDDPDDELKGCGLRALWPDHITAEELFALLTPPNRPSLLGAYQAFLIQDVAPHLKANNLPLALGWVEQQPGRLRQNYFDELEKTILAQAWENLDEPGVLEALARAVLSILSNHDDLFDVPITKDDEKRHKLTKAILPLLTLSENNWIWLVYSRSPLVIPRDALWLIELISTQPLVEQPILAKLIERTFDRQDEAHVNAVTNASEDNPILAAQLAWFLKPMK